MIRIICFDDVSSKQLGTLKQVGLSNLYKKDKGDSMKKTITMVLPTLAGLMLLAGAAHADFAAKCKMCHGEDAKSGMAKKDLTAVKTEDCVKAVKEGKGAMKPVTLAADDTAEKICGAAPIKTAAAAPVTAPTTAPTTTPTTK